MCSDESASRRRDKSRQVLLRENEPLTLAYRDVELDNRAVL